MRNELPGLPSAPSDSLARPGRRQGKGGKPTAPPFAPAPGGKAALGSGRGNVSSSDHVAGVGAAQGVPEALTWVTVEPWPPGQFGGAVQGANNDCGHILSPAGPLGGFVYREETQAPV